MARALETAFAHGDHLEEIAFGFYGGEPLLAKDLLGRAVDICARHRPEKRVRFSITTNATLVDQPIARLLRDADFSVLVSLDGPRAEHDRYRVYRNGRGS